MRRLALLALLAAGCASEPAPAEADYVARVGEAVLSEADLADALSATPWGVDSVAAREQFIEQWVTAQLLTREAERRGLREHTGVRRQLAASERAILADAALSALYEEDPGAFSRADLEAYFERSRERLRLREPYVRVRFVEATDADAAQAARDAMQRAMRTGRTVAARDSLFGVTARRYAADTAASLGLAASFVPQSVLTRQGPWAIVGQMGRAEVSPVLTTPDSTFFVVQLVERVPAGAEPELDWVEDEVRRQLAIQARKSAVAREVRRLRTEAEARGELDIRPPALADSTAAPPPGSPRGDGS